MTLADAWKMAEMSSWPDVMARLKRDLSLRTDPVGVALLQNAAQLSEMSGVRMLKTTAACQMIAISRYQREDGVVGAPAESMRCLWASACLGLIRTPERLSRGDLNRSFTADDDAARALQDEIFCIGNEGRRYSALITAPLDLMPLEPDAIVIYATPAQALKLLLGLSYEKGEVVNNPITGQAAVCQSIARAMREQRMTLEIPCVGDRTYGLVQDDELVVVVPAGRMERILNGMRSTDGFARYPFRPFLRWSAVFPPEFEPTRPELERE